LNTAGQITRAATPASDADLGMEGEAYVGDQVILIGNDGDSNISAESIAEKIQTTPHEITTCISNRVPRIFIE
jgi:alanine racemase